MSEEDDGRPVYKKASRVQEMVETIRGEKEKMGYTAQETSDVQAAWREANSVDREYKSTLESPFANKRPKKLYDDRRQAVVANVQGGTGPIITLRRGDLGVSADVLKVKNKNHNPRFVFHQGSKISHAKGRVADVQQVLDLPVRSTVRCPRDKLEGAFSFCGMGREGHGIAVDGFSGT